VEARLCVRGRCEFSPAWHGVNRCGAPLVIGERTKAAVERLHGPSIGLRASAFGPTRDACTRPICVPGRRGQPVSRHWTCNKDAIKHHSLTTVSIGGDDSSAGRQEDRERRRKPRLRDQLTALPTLCRWPASLLACLLSLGQPCGPVGEQARAHGPSCGWYSWHSRLAQRVRAARDASVGRRRRASAPAPDRRVEGRGRPRIRGGLGRKRGLVALG